MPEEFVCCICGDLDMFESRDEALSNNWRFIEERWYCMYCEPYTAEEEDSDEPDIDNFDDVIDEE